MTFECKECSREFASEQAFNDHNRSKHYTPTSDKRATSLIKGKHIFYLVIILIIISVGWLVMSISTESKGCKTADVTTLFINSHTGAKSHYHADLEIVINGEKQVIPLGVGLVGNIMRPIHTHDGTGHLHIEGPCIRDFTFGDFFKIWGKEFSSQCVLDSCVSGEGKGSLKMFVNGEESVAFGDLVLRDGQKIKIDYVG